MKKLLLLAAFGVAGNVGAKTISVRTCNINAGEILGKNSLDLSQKKIIIENHIYAPPTYQWVTIQSPCGVIYYLDLNQYSDDTSGLNQFGSDIEYFNQQKCGSQGESFQPSYT